MRGERPLGRRLRVTRRLVGRRVEQLHGRYARLFWAVHSVWALVTGVAVLVLAHNRYGFVKWVVLFLGLTWLSTLFFSRFARLSESRAFRFAQGFVSYLTRVMYQETLFFLIPFYFYSSTFPSWNSAYVMLLAALAVLSCFDMLFDRLMREMPWFALAFFLVVTFSALQFFIPLLLSIHITHGALIAAAVSLLAAVPLAFTWSRLRQPKVLLRLGLAVVLVLAGVKALRFAIPPVPLRLTRVRFSARIDPATLRVPAELERTVTASQLPEGKLYATATIFAPSRLPARLRLRFLRDSSTVRWSRTVSLVAHDKGFRIWDVYKGRNGRIEPGRYTVEIWTSDSQLVGRSDITVTP
ncbi:MAG TPA: DUF5924 family protein [Thermoanaerobaculaceae bacterium]|nr:DUF5924 family protein [Thermoanaerobaculaceae bacterium]HRS15735.1 DUF5924 family protein [Thermoanaerobaculaceae bacterium]